MSTARGTGGARRATGRVPGRRHRLDAAAARLLVVLLVVIWQIKRLGELRGLPGGQRLQPGRAAALRGGALLLQGCRSAEGGPLSPRKSPLGANACCCAHRGTRCGRASFGRLCLSLFFFTGASSLSVAASWASSNCLSLSLFAWIFRCRSRS